MGINIDGLLVENENLDFSKIEELLEIHLQKKGNISWAEAQTLQMGDNEMMLVNKNGCALVYFSYIFPHKHHNQLQKLLLSSKEGLLFSCSETSMIFIFEWYAQGRKTGEDTYVFEEEFEVYGDNKLGLTEDTDIIFYGLLPYIDSKISLAEDENIALYTYQPNKKVIMETANITTENPQINKELEISINTTKRWWQFWK